MTDSIKSFGISIAVSLIVFSLLAYIVKPDLNSLRDADDFRVVDFIRLKKDSSIKEKLRSIPDKPQPPKKPPPPQMEAPDLKTPPKAPLLDIEFPDINLPTDFGGAFVNAPSPGQSSQLIPLVRINPQYPRAELLSGVEGYVKVRFTVNEDGTVSKPSVVESRPPRVFDRAALNAIKKWKFKAKVVNGVAVKQDGVQVIDFKIN